MEKPILLTKTELLVPIKQALNRIEKIRQRKASNDDPIILEGLFVLAVASFENSINDTLRIFFKHIPQKLSIKNESLSKEDLLSNNLLEIISERKVLALSYKNLKDWLKYFFEISSLEEDNFFTSDYFLKLQEIKASRNLLLHNNLITNSMYLESAGDYKRANYIGSQLEIDQVYLYDSIITIRAILNDFRTRLLNKYDNYTRIQAIKNLWSYTFSTPVLKFENEWELDPQNDCIAFYKEETSQRGSLSTSEQMFLDIWIAHVKGMSRIELESSFYHLDNTNKRKLGYLVSVIDILKS